MLTVALKRTALRTLTRDGWLLFLTRSARLFAYGSLSVVLVLYLNSIGLSESQTDLLLSITLIGDTLVSLWLTTQADRIGRRWPSVPIHRQNAPAAKTSRPTRLGSSSTLWPGSAMTGWRCSRRPGSIARI